MTVAEGDLSFYFFFFKEHFLGCNESKSFWLRRLHVHKLLSQQAGHGQNLPSTAALYFPEYNKPVGLSLILPANGTVLSPARIPLVS